MLRRTGKGSTGRGGGQGKPAAQGPPDKTEVPGLPEFQTDQKICCSSEMQNVTGHPQCLWARPGLPAHQPLACTARSVSSSRRARGHRGTSLKTSICGAGVRRPAAGRARGPGVREHIGAPRPPPRPACRAQGCHAPQPATPRPLLPLSQADTCPWDDRGLRMGRHKAAFQDSCLWRVFGECSRISLLSCFSLGCPIPGSPAVAGKRDGNNGKRWPVSQVGNVQLS